MSPHLQLHPACLHVPQLACVHCQQRKVKCDKQSPCSACVRLGIACETVRRTRLPRGRSGKQSKNKDVLADRVKRLEELVTSATVTFEVVGKQQSQRGGELDGLIASGFWSNLSDAVTGLKEALVQRDGEIDTAPSEHETASQLSWTSLGNAQLLQPEHALSDDELFELYKDRFHPLFRVLHWPTTSFDMHEATGGASKSENDMALREAVLFGASCTVLSSEHEDRDNLIAHRRGRAETALMTAGLLTTKDVQVLQAFLIYLAALRSCQGNALQWSLVALAVRLAQGMKLSKRRDASAGEVNLWTWWSIGILDLQAAFDRGSEPLLEPHDLIDIPDAVDRETDEALGTDSSRRSHLSFGESSTASLTYKAMYCQLKILHERSSQHHRLSALRSKQISILEEFETYVDDVRVAQIEGQTSRDLHSFALAIGDESVLAMRLLIHRPLQEASNMDVDVEDTIDVLGTATKLLESAVFKTSPAFRQWSWFRWPKWYALAIVLAELITKPLPWDAADEHSWAIAQQSFVSYASIVADGETGMLWWPIANLMLRARTKLVAERNGRAIDDELFESVLRDTLASDTDPTRYSLPSKWSAEPWIGLVSDYQSKEALREEPNWEQWLQMEYMP